MTEQCIVSVIPRNIFPQRVSQCSRTAWKDGFCKQHHPANRKPKKPTYRELEAENERAWSSYASALRLSAKKEAKLKEIHKHRWVASEMFGLIEAWGKEQGYE